MPVFIQDPNDAQCPFVLDALIEACKVSTQGGGAFAYVTADGVELFLKRPEFKRFAASRAFELVIGLDGITNPPALEAIGEVEKACPGLKARAFLPDQARTTFHPKFSWFRTPKGGVVVTGSGNLTGGGLRRNVEAFDCHDVSTADIDMVEGRWRAFAKLNESRLRPLKDPEVVKHAEANAIVQREFREIRAAAAKRVGVRIPRAEDAESAPYLDDAVLVAEIPRGSTRWNQANFDLDNFINFFGAKPERSSSISLYHVAENGRLGPREVRPSVAVKSHNYRFELEAAGGLPYPSNGRPIAVFVRVAPATFRYRLLMPGKAGHAEVQAYLTQTTYVPVGRVRRRVMPAAELKAVWPDSPLWRGAA